MSLKTERYRNRCSTYIQSSVRHSVNTGMIGGRDCVATRTAIKKCLKKKILQLCDDPVALKGSFAGAVESMFPFSKAKIVLYVAHLRRSERVRGGNAPTSTNSRSGAGCFLAAYHFLQIFIQSRVCGLIVQIGRGYISVPFYKFRLISL